MITVEPGCYFIDALLIPALQAPETSDFFNRKELDKYKDFGGVRIESDVVCPNLSTLRVRLWAFMKYVTTYWELFVFCFDISELGFDFYFAVCYLYWL